jgi:hypothetical protein
MGFQPRPGISRQGQGIRSCDGSQYALCWQRSHTGSPDFRCYNPGSRGVREKPHGLCLRAGLRGRMSGLARFATVLMLFASCFLALSWTAAAQKGGVRTPAKKKQQKQEQPAPAPLPTYTPAPLQPVPLDQTPAVAPKVSFEDGQLSIVAHNSTLADVLHAVRKQTGADLEIPPGASERVVADIGPGPARDVIAELLNGTHFNYVLVGSATDPTAVESIVLTPKATGADNAPAVQATSPGLPQRPLGRRGFPQTASISPSPSVQDDTSGMDDNDNSDDADQAEAQDNQQQTNPPNPGPTEAQTPKTPEQLLQDLQRQQQLRQQQQQQSGQPPQPGQQPQGLFPNLPPTQVPSPPAKPE